MNRPPAEIKPWHGPVRGFSFAREVQPVLDRYCVGCHDGQPRPDGSDDRRPARRREDHRLELGHARQRRRHAGKFSVGYAELHRYVRRPGIESDYHLLAPMEFHADTTRAGADAQEGPPRRAARRRGLGPADHLDRPELPVPRHVGRGDRPSPGEQRERRRELLKLYANVDDDPEAVPETPAAAGRADRARSRRRPSSRSRRMSRLAVRRGRGPAAPGGGRAGRRSGRSTWATA